MGDIVKHGEISIRKMLNKARSDIALADPVGWLIRVAQSGQLDGEMVAARDRIAIMMRMAEKIVPNADEKTADTNQKMQMPPLQIILNGGRPNNAGFQEVINVSPTSKSEVMKMVDEMENAE